MFGYNLSCCKYKGNLFIGYEKCFSEKQLPFAVVVLYFLICCKVSGLLDVGLSPCLNSIQIYNKFTKHANLRAIISYLRPVFRKSLFGPIILKGSIFVTAKLKEM